MAERRDRRGATLFFFGAAALLAWIAAPTALLSSDCRDLDVGIHADPGEALLHRVQPAFSMDASGHMPLLSLWATQVCRHSSPAGFKALAAVSLAAPGALILVLGCLVGSPLSSLAALAMTIAVTWDRSLPLQWLYSGFVLLAACALVWRARAPSLGRSLVAALALGAGLLFRSPLFLFPPVLVLYESLITRRGALKAYWKHAVLLLLVPYLFLLPWIGMNWASHRRFVPLEDGEADCNVVTSALGLVRVARGDCRGLIKDPAQRASGGMIGWAVGEVLREPFRYAEACVARLAWVLRRQPLLFIAALPAFWLLRRRAETAALALLAGYFLFIHCLLAVHEQYFIPLWPLLAVTVASAPAALAGRQPRPDLAADRWAVRGLGAFVLLALAVSASGLASVSAYWRQAARGRLDSDEALEGAIARAPADAWLLSERGRRSLGRGMVDAAIPDLAKALSLKPESRRSLDLARALAAKGLPEPLLRSGMPDDADPARDAQAHAARALVWLERGDGGRARAELSSARAALAPRHEDHDPDSKAQLSILAVMNSEVEGELSGLLKGELMSRPPARREALAQELLELTPANERASLRVALHDQKRPVPPRRGVDLRERTLADLARAEKANSSPERRLRMAALSRELGRFERAGGLLGGLLAQKPGDPALWLEKAKLAAARGDAPSARAALSRFETLFVKSAPDDPELWLEQAETSLRADDPSRARRSLARVMALSPRGEFQRRAALAYQEMKDYKQALSLWDRLASDNPREAGVLSDRGLCRYLAGATSQALDDVNAAIRLDPGYLAAYLTLGAIDENEHRPAEALAIYDAALAQPDRGGGSLREVIERNRARILKRP